MSNARTPPASGKGARGQTTDRGKARRPGDATLRALLDFGSDAVITVDSQGRLIAANRRACELLGAPEADLRRHLVADFLHADDAPESSKSWHSVLGTEQPARFEHRIVRRNGEVRHCEGTAQVLPGGEVLLILRDSTETGARLRDTAHHLSVAASKAPIVLWAVDREMRFTTAQGSGLAALGITEPTEMLGRTAQEVFPELPEALSYLGRALAGESLYLRVVARGATFENWYIPVRDDHGSVVAVQGVAVDVSERVKAESESIRILESLDEAQHLGGLGSWDEDLATGETRWSQQLYRIFAFEPGSFVPTRDALLEVISAVDRLAFEETIAGLLHEGGCAEQTLRGRRGDGAERVFHVRALMSHDSNGSPPRFFGTVQDITERDRARREMRRAKESLSEAQRVAGVGSWEWDVRSGDVRWSDELYRMLGVTNEENLVETFMSRLHADDRDRVVAAARVVMDGGLYPLTLFRIVHPECGVRWLEQRAAIQGPAASTHVIGTVQDVTEREIARHELRRADERLREAQRVAQVGSWEWTRETGVGFWSDELYRLLGLAPQTAAPSPSNLLGAVHEADRSALRGAIDDALNGRTSEPVYCRVVRSGGETRHVRILAKALSHRGDPDRVVGTVQDVTVWRRAEERMSVLSSALEQTADAAYVTDRDGVILFANEAFVLQSGYSREEILGQTTRLIKSGVHTSEFYRAFWEHILSGKVWRGTFVNRRKDGSLYHEEKAITPIRAADGHVTHFVTTGRDITERRGEEEAQARVREVIARSAHEWRSTFDAVDTPIVILDADGCVRRPNRAARDLAGAPYAALMGAPVRDLGAGGLWSAMAEAASRVKREGRATSLQAQDQPTGRTWDVSASPLTEPGIDEGAVIVLARDVSPIINLQDSLRRMETISAMGRLVAGVAHEVRNPLFAISATLDAFDADLSPHPGYRQYSDILRGEVARLTHLMQGLLEYGRPSAPQLERSSLSPIIERACTACAAIIRERGVSVERVIDDDLPAVDLDPGRFRQVIQNLVENAAQHSPIGSAVQVRARSIEDGSRVEIEIVDSGPGFRGEDMAHLFEPFYSRRRGGTGLGLSIVQRIVMEHGGEVQVANLRDGGASVVVSLPSLRPAQ
jgi:PAS domain S-box-containing protein